LQIADLQRRVGMQGPTTSQKDIHWSHDGVPVEGSRSTPYVIQWATAEISGVIMGAKSTSNDDTTIGIFVNDDLVDTCVLLANDDTEEDFSINAPISQFDKVQVGIVELGEGLEGLSVLVKITHPIEDPYMG
jgi:hypothetical protein